MSHPSGGLYKCGFRKKAASPPCRGEVEVTKASHALVGASLSGDACVERQMMLACCWQRRHGFRVRGILVPTFAVLAWEAWAEKSPDMQPSRGQLGALVGQEDRLPAQGLVGHIQDHRPRLPEFRSVPGLGT